MAQTINGFACNNPAEAALARRGIDPTGSKQAAKAQPAVAQARLTGPSAAPAAEPALTGRGRFVNLLA